MASVAFIVTCCALLSYLLVEGAWTSITLAVGALAVLRAQVLFAKLGSIRKLMLFLLFTVASVDINKAIVPPLERFYAPGLYITLAQAILILWTVLWFIERLLIERRGLPVTKLDLAALFFLGVHWWGAFRSPAGDLAIASAVAYTLCVLGFYVVSHSMVNKEDIRLALRGLLFAFAAHALLSAAQMAVRGPIHIPGLKVVDMSSMTLGYGDTSAFRPFGLFDHPNTLADYVIWLQLPALALVMLGKQRLSTRVWRTALATFVLSTALLLATLSRGGWAAAVLGTIVIAVAYARRGLLTRRHVAIAAGVVTMAVVAVLLVYPQVLLRLTEPDARSTESRLFLNDQAFKIIAERPLTGFGLGSYNATAINHIPPSWGDISADYQEQLLKLVVHNSYLLTAAELGIPASIYWLGLLVAVAACAWPLRQWKDPAMFALGVGTAGAVAAHILFLASDNYYIDIRIAMLWLAAGFLQALKLQAQGGHDTEVACR